MKLLVAIICLISFKTHAQSGLFDTVWWEGNERRFTILNEITKADIILKKGGKLKNVGLSKLSSGNTLLEYIDNLTLHDIQTEKIDKIIPGTPFQYALVFGDFNKPTIIRTEKNDAFKTYVVFPSITIKSYEVSGINQTSIINLTADSVSNAKQQCDTLIFESNKKLLIHVREINSKEIKYERADIPNGPIYIIKTEGLFIREINNIKVIQQKHN